MAKGGKSFKAGRKSVKAGGTKAIAMGGATSSGKKPTTRAYAVPGGKMPTGKGGTGVTDVGDVPGGVGYPMGAKSKSMP